MVEPFRQGDDILSCIDSMVFSSYFVIHKYSMNKNIFNIDIFGFRGARNEDLPMLNTNPLPRHNIFANIPHFVLTECVFQ